MKYIVAEEEASSGVLGKGDIVVKLIPRHCYTACIMNSSS